jgi:hypothetical protein
MEQSPGIYEGDYAKSKVFMEKFEIWRWLNCGHPTMANPSNWIMMFYTHLIGPKVDGWARGWVNELERSIAAGNVNPNAEILWTEFWDQFYEDFQDTAMKEDTLHKLMNLWMQGDDLNTYTTMFCWERDPDPADLTVRTSRICVTGSCAFHDYRQFMHNISYELVPWTLRW